MKDERRIKLFLAPMASITDWPFRLIVKKRFGVDVAVSELLSSHGIHYRDEKTLRLCQFHPEERPVGAQIFGHDMDKLISAAQYLASLGYDFVDLNMGCPVQKVVQKGGGAGMIRDVNRALDMMRRIKNAISIPLTIKIRLGWDERHIVAPALVAGAYEIGVKWVAIHGRTRKQGYRGPVDWLLMRSLAEKYPNFIVGNGEIRSLEDYQSAVGRAPFLGVMIGRAALSHPWLFREIALGRQHRPDTAFILDYLGEYLEYARAFNPHPRYVNLRLRKMAAWLSAGFPQASQFRRKIFAAIDASPDVLFEAVREFFGAVTKLSWAHRTSGALYEGLSGES